LLLFVLNIIYEVIPMFKGSITALVTPFTNNTIDEDNYRNLINWQIDQGSHGLVPVGTTGESPTLSHDEHKRAVSICVDESSNRVPVIAGAGSNNTSEAIDFLKFASDIGADAGLVVTPYYNKPNQVGLYEHFKALNDSSDIPIIIYNIPGRCVIDMSIETISKLYKLKNIIGIKDATGDVGRISRQRKALGNNFLQFSGEDMTALGVMSHGGHGCISVTANIAPSLCAKFQESCMNGDYELALKYQDMLTPLHEALFIETSPSPIKYALSLLGRCESKVRLPLVEVSEETKQIVRKAMEHAELIG
jgi:4-hydroxy-tetrahydrodipicolinate synthase